MVLIEDLFVAANVTEVETIVYRLRRNIPVLHLYCIVFFADKNRLEILPSRTLFRQRNQNRPAQIAGIAMGKQEAYALFSYMVEDARKNGRNPLCPLELIR